MSFNVKDFVVTSNHVEFASILGGASCLVSRRYTSVSCHSYGIYNFMLLQSSGAQDFVALEQ